MYVGNLDLIAHFDLEHFLDQKSLNFVIYGLGNHGGAPSELVGTNLTLSNIEAPSTFKIYELYFEKAVADKFGILFGWRDLNADYHTLSFTSGLINSVFGIGPAFSQTGVNGPSIFPQTALSLNMKYQAENNVYLQAGAFNAVSGKSEHPYGTHLTTSLSGGVMYVAEIGYAVETKSKYAMGGWLYSQKFESFNDSENRRPNCGYYLLVQQSLAKQILLFFKHTIANSHVNQFSSSSETGFAFHQLSFGMGLVHAAHNQPNIEMDEHEAVLEINYRVDIGYGMAVIPDYQYLFNPGLNPGVSNSHVGGLRFETIF